MSVETAVRTLTDADVRYAVIGAVALAARGASRSTFDLDLLVVERRVLHDDFWEPARSAGAEIEIRTGDFDDPLAGVVRIGGPEPVDIIVAKYRWQSDILTRAQPVLVRGFMLPIPRSADLVLLKLFAGGYRDIDDIRTLLHVSEDALVAEVSSALESLPAEMHERWTRLLAER
jgi:predicted nucleotidyltransferase